MYSYHYKPLYESHDNLLISGKTEELKILYFCGRNLRRFVLNVPPQLVK